MLHRRSIVRLNSQRWVMVAAALLLTSCSGSQDTTTTTTSVGTGRPGVDAVTTTKPHRPDGPAADLSEELSGGKGPFVASGNAEPVAESGYVAHEYVAAGTATSYDADGALGGNGRWTLRPAGTAAYRTRVFVRRPKHAADFSGTVVVEWLNVSGGLDAPAEYSSLREELTRNGDIWVGVSAQRIGVEGGPVLVSTPGSDGIAGVGLKKIDPATPSTDS